MENLPKIGDHACRLKINIIVEILWVKNERAGLQIDLRKKRGDKEPMRDFSSRVSHLLGAF